MKKFMYVFILFLSYTFLSSQTTIPAGDISGNWLTNGSPYLIEGEITIPDGETLTIDPGVIVEFQGHYKLNVQGQILAIGTELDSIRFTVADTTGYYNYSHIGWHGIRFDNTPATNDSSKFNYCHFEYAKAVGPELEDWLGGVFYFKYFGKVQISYSTLYYNYAASGAAGIYCSYYSSPLIEHNNISHNYAGDENPGSGWGCGISLYRHSSPNIRNNIISNNIAYGAIGININCSSPIIRNNIISNNQGLDTGGILVTSSPLYRASPIIINNLIFGNQVAYMCGGIKCYSDTLIIIANNTIFNNESLYGGGLVFSGEHIQLVNNIVWGNNAAVGNQVYLWMEGTNPNFYNCDIQGGVEAFGGDGAPFFNGDYENCIDSDPLFVDTVLNDFHLQDSSFCIGSGIDEITIGEITYACPEFDIEGNPRPNPIGSTPDIGAYENQFGEPQVDIYENCILNYESFILFNYPNPFNPETKISFNLLESGSIKLEIFNIKGQIIKTLVNNELIKGSHSFIWNGDDESNKPVSSGVYLYKLNVNGKTEIMKKCLLLK